MLLKLKVIFYSLITIFILYAAYLMAIPVSKGEVDLTNDIGRDFLLLQELDQKKIVLIGARSNSQGIFHGPLWTYLNYPAYLIGHGNPVVVAWFWVVGGYIFLATTFIILRKLFGTFAAFLTTAFFAVGLIPRTDNIFGQEATFYFIPFFIFTIYRYLQNKKPFYLFLHFLTAGIIMQLNIGVGGLFAMMSLLLSGIFIVRNRLWKHILSFLVLPAVLFTYVIFELRHQFVITKSLIKLATFSQFLLPIKDWLLNRLGILITMQIPGYENIFFQLILFTLIMVFSLLEIKRNTKRKNILLLLAFYYFGYMVLSYFNKGILLTDYLYILVPLSFTWLAALVSGSYKVIFIPILLFLLYINVNYAQSYLSYLQGSFIGKSPDSWVALDKVAQSVIVEQKGEEFGYYVYSPDAYAYQQRYAMIYAFHNAKAKADEYVKKPITYVISAPHPVNDPYVDHEWWIRNEAKILSAAVDKKDFPGGYIVEKFNLTKEEQKVLHDPNIEVKLHFR